MRILVVDDEKLLVKGITFNLENEGYKVDVAYDGEEALKLARDKNLDINAAKTEAKTYLDALKNYGEIDFLYKGEQS